MKLSQWARLACVVASMGLAGAAQAKAQDEALREKGKMVSAEDKARMSYNDCLATEMNGVGWPWDCSGLLSAFRKGNAAKPVAGATKKAVPTQRDDPNYWGEGCDSGCVLGSE